MDVITLNKVLAYFSRYRRDEVNKAMSLMSDEELNHFVNLVNQIREIVNGKNK